MTEGVRKNSVPTLLADPRRSITFNSTNVPTELTSTIQASATPNVPQSVTLSCPNTSIATPSTGALAANWTAVPDSTSMSRTKRFWYTVPAPSPTSPTTAHSTPSGERDHWSDTASNTPAAPTP